MMRDYIIAQRGETCGDSWNQLLGGRMVAVEGGGDLGRAVIWIKRCARFFVSCLEPFQFVPADVQQIGERYIDHLLVGEHAPVGVGTDGIVAGSARQKISLEPFCVFLDRGDQLRVSLEEGGFFWSLRDRREGFDEIFLQEIDHPRHLRKRDIEGHLRGARRFQVDASNRKIMQRGCFRAVAERIRTSSGAKLRLMSE